MACKYCGDDAQGRIDKYGEEECSFCGNFWAQNPTIDAYVANPKSLQGWQEKNIKSQEKEKGKQKK